MVFLPVGYFNGESNFNELFNGLKCYTIATCLALKPNGKLKCC